MRSDKVGRVVWHDLFTDDVSVSKSFYEKVAGWYYVTEHATDFAWGGGEGDFILALSGNEAGAGFVEHSDIRPHGWVPYVEVSDVDSAARKATELGGSLVRAPFDVPGVGRNCILRDPIGALLGMSVSQHAFPVPTIQFGPELYQAGSSDFPAPFYHQLFGWDISQPDDANPVSSVFESAGKKVGFLGEFKTRQEAQPSWIPCIRVADLSEASHRVQDAQGSIIERKEATPGEYGLALIADKNGVTVCLTET